MIGTAEPKPLPPRPSKLSLWMYKHSRPTRLTVEYRPTGVDTAETVIILEVIDSQDKVLGKTEVSRGDLLENNSYGHDPGQDVQLRIDHAHVADWTANGKKRLGEYLEWEKKEARDLADYRRLHTKFGGHGIEPTKVDEANRGLGMSEYRCCDKHPNCGCP